MILEYEFRNGYTELDTDDFIDEVSVYQYLKHKFEGETDREKIVRYFKGLGYDIEAMITHNNEKPDKVADYDSKNINDLFCFADETCIADTILKAEEVEYSDWAHDVLEYRAIEKFENEYEEESEDDFISDLEADEADRYWEMGGNDL